MLSPPAVDDHGREECRSALASMNLNFDNYYCDEECSSVTTCQEELPELLRVRLVNVNIGSSFGGKIKGIQPSTGAERTIGIALETNEDGILVGQESEGIEDELKFVMDQVDLVFKRKKLFDADPEKVVLEVKGRVRAEKDEWHAIVQGRIYTAVEQRQFNLVDADLFELGTQFKPLELEIAPEVMAIKLELCIVYQVYHKMPKFKKGNIELCFPGDPVTLRAKTSLLSLYTTSKLIENFNTLRPEDSLELTECNRQEFTALLYQIYQSKRSPKTDFRSLCSAATKYGNQFVLWPLYQEIILDSTIDFRKKVDEAANLGLNEAVRALCYDAVKNGCWEDEQKRGADFRKLFGNDVYFGIVCPAVIEAYRDRNSEDPNLKTCLYEQKYPRDLPNFHSVSSSTNPFNVCVLVDNRRFYVNRGILEINGCLKTFVELENGFYRPTVSAELKHELARNNIRGLEPIFVPLLHMMHGIISRVDMQLVRPLLIFTHNHRMAKQVAELEELLVTEPVNSAALLLDHLILAEQYGLKNLERKSLWHVEWEEFHKYGLEMLSMADYNEKLSPMMRKNVEDRICSGWSIHETRLQKKLPTDCNVRLLRPDSSTPMYDIRVDQLITEGLTAVASFEAFSDYQDTVDEKLETMREMGEQMPIV